MRIIIIDNYDSFTYNLYHLIEAELYDNDSVEVFRNDKIEVSNIKEYDKIIISPGPGLPSEAGITNEVINFYKGKKSILGVCLGHQAIAEHFGCKLLNLDKVMHGKEINTHVTDKEEILFKNIPEIFKSGRYHSWVVNKETIPECLSVTAVDESDHVMAIKHKEYDIKGVQFHPESIMTKHGSVILKNWIYS